MQIHSTSHYVETRRNMPYKQPKMISVESLGSGKFKLTLTFDNPLRVFDCRILLSNINAVAKQQKFGSRFETVNTSQEQITLQFRSVLQPTRATPAAIQIVRYAAGLNRPHSKPFVCKINPNFRRPSIRSEPPELTLIKLIRPEETAAKIY